jgi:hypothetical protein
MAGAGEDGREALRLAAVRPGRGWELVHSRLPWMPGPSPQDGLQPPSRPRVRLAFVSGV